MLPDLPHSSSLPGNSLKSGSKRGACSDCRGILYAVWGGLFFPLSFKDRRIVKVFVVISHVQAVKIQSGIVILLWEMNKMQFCWLLSALIFHPWIGCFSKNPIPLGSVWVAGFFFSLFVFHQLRWSLGSLEIMYLIGRNSIWVSVTQLQVKCVAACEKIS